MRVAILFGALVIAGSAFQEADLIAARDKQDRAALDKIVNELRAAAEKQPKDAAAQYRLALANSYAAEVAIEMRDKAAGRNFAQAGIDAGERAVALKQDSPEYHRILGTLCGQIIAGAGLAAIKYGKCALSEVNRAIELDPKSSIAYLSHGVGNYYLPPAFGGGLDKAAADFRKAIELNPKSDEAYLWLGITLRRLNQPSEARKAIAKSLELNPNRVWAKQQLDKTPAP